MRNVPLIPPRSYRAECWSLWVRILYGTSSTAKAQAQNAPPSGSDAPKGFSAAQGFKQTHSPLTGRCVGHGKHFSGKHPPPSSSAMHPARVLPGCNDSVCACSYEGDNGTLFAHGCGADALVPAQGPPCCVPSLTTHDKPLAMGPPQDLATQECPWDQKLAGLLTVQGTVRKTGPKAWRKPRAEGAAAPGTDLEPPRAGKDPGLRPEEMLERRGGREGQREGGRGQSPRKAETREMSENTPGICPERGSAPVREHPNKAGSPPLRAAGHLSPQRSPSEEPSSVK